MTQPTFVPIAEADQVRPARHMHVPGSWTTSRPAELVVPAVRRGRGVGTPGPDSGFALRLANRFAHELKLVEGESEHDVRFALNLWGFLDQVPGDRVAERRAAFSSIAHDYVAQRRLVDAVPEETLRLSPEDALAKGGVAA